MQAGQFWRRGFQWGTESSGQYVRGYGNLDGCLLAYGDRDVCPTFQVIAFVTGRTASRAVADIDGRWFRRDTHRSRGERQLDTLASSTARQQGRVVPAQAINRSGLGS